MIIKIQKIKRSGLCNFQPDKKKKRKSQCFFSNRHQHWISLNDNNKQEIAQKTQTNVTTHTFLVYHSKASVLLSTENGIWRQTTSFCCASVISCGISGTDVPPQISRALQGGCRDRASRISNYCVELLIQLLCLP